MPFPSCQLVNRYYQPVSDLYEEKKVFTPRSWQKELSAFCETGLYIQVHAPGGCGKTTWAAYNSLAESLRTNNSRKSLFLAPMTAICDCYAKPLFFSYKGEKRVWSVKYRYGSDPAFASIKDIRDFLSMPVRGCCQNLCATATHQGWIHFWGDLSRREKEAFLQDITIYIDECHHCTEEKTKIGNFLTDVLEINSSTCRVVVMTATMFRGDEEEIIPKRFQSKFSSWMMRFEDYMEILQIKNFHFDYIGYDEDPIAQVEEIIKKHRDKKHIIVLPHTGNSFRKGDTFYNYMGMLVRLFHPDRVLDLVTKSKQNLNQTLLKNHPENYDAVIACQMMIEGTDWPPASVVHNTRFGYSHLEAVQISFRLFRKFTDKKEIWNYIYLRNDLYTGEARKVFSDRLNILLLQILMADHVQPLKIPLLVNSPYHKRTGRKSASFLSLFNLKKRAFDELLGQIIKAHDLEDLEMRPTQLKVRRFDKIADSFYTRHKLSRHVAKNDFKRYVLKMLFRINRIATHEKESDKLDVSFIREEGFDKVWEKEGFLGSFVMGTKEPISVGDMEALRKIHDRHMEQRLQASEVDYDWALEKFTFKKKTRKKDPTPIQVTGVLSSPFGSLKGRWIKFEVPQGYISENTFDNFGYVIAQNNSEVLVTYYKGKISIEEQRIILSIEKKGKTHRYDFCGTYWRPVGLSHPPYAVSAKIAERFFFENSVDIYGGRKMVPKLEITIPTAWITRVLTCEGDF